MSEQNAWDVAERGGGELWPNGVPRDGRIFMPRIKPSDAMYQLASALDRYVVWRNTPQGQEYWMTVHENLTRLAMQFGRKEDEGEVTLPPEFDQTVPAMDPAEFGEEDGDPDEPDSSFFDDEDEEEDSDDPLDPSAVEEAGKYAP